MILNENNFVINLIQISSNKTVTCNEIKNNDGFTSNNSANILGHNNLKYKLMFSNIELLEDTEYVIFQISIKYNDKYFNPYLFTYIEIKNSNNLIESPGRALTYTLFDKKFDFVWIYITKDYVQEIINKFSSSDKIIETQKYIKEYIQINQDFN
jgi:hypothetical protein